MREMYDSLSPSDRAYVDALKAEFVKLMKKKEPQRIVPRNVPLREQLDRLIEQNK